MTVLLLSGVPGSLSEIAATLAKHAEAVLVTAHSGGEALNILKNETVDLVITQEKLGDMTGFKFIEGMLCINPMINSIVIGSLSPEEFHKSYEGLGVLAQVPAEPGEKQTQVMLECLNTLKKIQR